MTDLTDKTWLAIGETDDSNALIETCDAEEAVTKGAPVCLSNDQSLSYNNRIELHRSNSEKCHCQTRGHLPNPNLNPSLGEKLWQNQLPNFFKQQKQRGNRNEMFN